VLVGGDIESLHLLDLFYQISFLVVELVVLGPVVVKPRQKLYQLLSIAQQDFLDWTRLIGIRNEHLITTR